MKGFNFLKQLIAVILYTVIMFGISLTLLNYYPNVVAILGVFLIIFISISSIKLFKREKLIVLIRQPWYKVIVILFIFGIFLDGLSTYIFLSNGTSQEQNILVQLSIVKLGLLNGLLLHVLIVITLFVMVTVIISSGKIKTGFEKFNIFPYHILFLFPFYKIVVGIMNFML